MKIHETYTYTMPTWAICAIFNGDLTGVNDEEEKQIDEFLAAESYIDAWELIDDEPSFSPSPEFGLPCETYIVRGIVWANDED